MHLAILIFCCCFIANLNAEAHEELIARGDRSQFRDDDKDNLFEENKRNLWQEAQQQQPRNGCCYDYEYYNNGYDVNSPCEYYYYYYYPQQ